MRLTLEVVATTLREVHSSNRHSWSAVAWVNGQTHVAPTCELDVIDRVGGGEIGIHRAFERVDQRLRGA